MPEDIRKVLERLKDDISMIEKWDRSYWNKLMGTNHLKSAATMLKNDADTVANYMRNF